MITDNYKLVPFTGSKVQLPCAVCPLDEICCAYSTYMTFNEIEVDEGSNSLLDQCLKECCNEDGCLIPVLNK